MSVFFDTSLFVYAVSQAAEDQDKRRVASGLIAEGEFSLSAQVIQEFIHTCLRKARLGQTPDAIRATAEFLFNFPCAVPSQELVLHALALQARFQISYWDAAILAAARELGCPQLYTEDLNHGQDYDGVQVINPLQ
ncbi:MAG: PIN domain-containing protein [Verrucomicrobiae bacterium]|nr:PIN domain-containing protein [Verrucomicrobiae bacterium]